MTGAPKVRVKRLPEKQVDDPTVLAEILRAGVLAHLAAVVDGQPYVLPVAYAPWSDGIVLHGSNASRLFRHLASGAPTCATITLLDGLVYARSAFESSMEYRSAMLFGSAVQLTGDRKAAALRAISDHLLPGRWEHIRPPSEKEDKATMVLHLQPDSWSVKVGSGFADDVPADLELLGHVWAGRVPLSTTAGPAIPDPTSAANGTPVPAHVADIANGPN